MYLNWDSSGDVIIAQGGGKVGFGTTTPSEKIHVKQGNALIEGTTTSISYACSSDLRWKKNITPIDSALQKVLGLRGVYYFWKVDEFKDKGFTREKQIGFIAQEVENVIPELVYTDKAGYKTMSYDRVTALLVEAVKELKKQSDTKIASLEKENAQLKNRLASLEKLEQRMAVLEKAQNGKGLMVGMK
ncbi:MAG: tail fiber domain-containing protein [Spirochaetes bacterium]|nr:tail fiber domain-containing protein [Spirochaetota bacterium]